MKLFNRNKLDERIEELGLEEDKMYAAEKLEGWEDSSLAFVEDEEDHREYEHREELLEETDTFEIFKQLRGKLDKFERIREELRTEIESASKLLPKLSEEKERLVKYVHQKREKIAEIINLVPELEKKKKNIQEDIERKHEVMERLEKVIHRKQERVAQITNLIPELDEKKKKIQKSMEREQKEISRMGEEIKIISFAQKYRTKLIKL